MRAVEKAIWFIENNFRDDIALTAVAEAVSLSKFHLVRAFGVCTGHSVDGYIRARRLSEAAKQLARGSAGILETALDAGYGSHEAFSRAFRQRFGVTPEQIRKAGDLSQLDLQEPLKMNEDLLADLAEPTIVRGDALLLVGLLRRYSERNVAEIPSQWQDFTPHLDAIPRRVGNTTFGVCCNSDSNGSTDYLAGVAVTSADDLPAPLTTLRLPARTYAVFEHHGHVSGIRRTWASIFALWQPPSGRQLVDAPQFERYDDRFDPHSGAGMVEIWIPMT